MNIKFAPSIKFYFVCYKALSVVIKTKWYCQAEGFPPPVSNWSRLLQKFPLARTELGDGNLTITNLSTTDSGLYECVVMNAMGVKKTRMNLVVQKGG